MADDDKDKAEPAVSAARAGSTPVNQPFTTMAEMQGIVPAEGMPDERFSQSPGLEIIPGSEVPGLGNGGMVNHVQGPGQAPVDPIAAGLDMGYIPKTAGEMRLITHTGDAAAGPRPSTYAEKPDGLAVKQSTSDPAPPGGIANVAARGDADAKKA